MPSRRLRGNSRQFNRSYLFLSMTLLVWNAFATGGVALRSASPCLPVFPENMPAESMRVPGNPAVVDNVTPRNAPLSVRQKYLLGKRIDINTALMEEINSLPGISDETAADILAERKRIGRFRSPEDLLRVKGIKEKRLRKILPFLEKMDNN